MADISTQQRKCTYMIMKETKFLCYIFKDDQVTHPAFIPKKTVVKEVQPFERLAHT